MSSILPIDDVSSSSNLPLVKGQLRYLTTSAIGMRIVEVQSEVAIVHRIPGETVLRVRALHELRKAPLMAPEGFRIRWLTGILDLEHSSEQEILLAIFADECARGNDRIRVKVLDDYTKPLLNGDELREKLMINITSNEFWKIIGSGTDLGYVPSNTILDWRVRWGKILPRQVMPKSESEAIEKIKEIDIENLNKIYIEKSFPTVLRKAALEKLILCFRQSKMQADFRSIHYDVTKEIMNSFSKYQDPTHLLNACANSTISFLVREHIHQLLLSRNDYSVDNILRQVSLKPNAIVYSHWFRILKEPASKVEVLSLLLRTKAPSDDEENRTSKNIYDSLMDCGFFALSILVKACQQACTTKEARQNAITWLRRIVPEKEVLFLDAIDGLATLYRLRDGNRDEFTQLGLPQRRIQDGLARWLVETAAEIEQVSPPDWAASINDINKSWEHSCRVVTKNWRASLRYEELYEAASLLIDARINDKFKIIEITSKSEDLDNARRVLQKHQAEEIRSERSELLQSVWSEVASTRDAEQIKIARIIIETITAIERINESMSDQALYDVGIRIRELTEDLDLVVQGHIGERVIVDPTKHETHIREHETGQIRRVGIIDKTGKVLIRSYVGAIGRL